jgi:hypothetical protein
LVNETPFPVPDEALRPDFPISSRWDAQPSTTLDWIDSEAFHEEVRRLLWSNVVIRREARYVLHIKFPNK